MKERDSFLTSIYDWIETLLAHPQLETVGCLFFIAIVVGLVVAALAYLIQNFEMPVPN
jgi:hypothetical protein